MWKGLQILRKILDQTRSNKKQRDWQRQYTGPSFRDKDKAPPLSTVFQDLASGKNCRDKDKDKNETRFSLATNAKIRQKTKPRATVDNAKASLSEEPNLPKGVNFTL